MLPRVCQLKCLLISLLIFTASCTSRKPKPIVLDDHELMSVVDPVWFKVNDLHSLKDKEGKPEVHLFYDVFPEFKEKEKLANIVLTTVPGSAHSYALDINSGQRYYSHSYCPQHDVWGATGNAIDKPTFGIGYLPRVLDQLGGPQKVIFFSSRPNVRASDNKTYRVRIVAAYVEQYCPEGNCLGKENWLSRLVLMAVDQNDPKYSQIRDADAFTKEFNWPNVKAQLENIDGRSFLGDNTFPLVRIRNIINFNEAYTYFKKNSVVISGEESKKIQQSCHNLYEKLWKEVGSEPTDKLEAGKTHPSFAERFKKFSKKYYDQAVTCEKYVYHGNLNQDPEKFWFLSYMAIFYRLNKDGHYFSCTQKSWHQNLKNAEGKPYFELKKDLDACTEKDLDTAFTYLPNYLGSLKAARQYYRFVDYDNHHFGTHRKLYSWVKMNSYKYDCSSDPNRVITKELDLFPADIKWKPRATTEGRRDREAIIQ